MSVYGLGANAAVVLCACTVRLFACAFGLAIWLFLTRTRFGAAMRALAIEPTGARLVGVDANAMSALAFALLSSSVVAVVGGTVLGARLEWWRYGALFAVLAIGGIPFALLGIALGYWLPPRSAMPVANLVYLPLAVMGALWGKPDDLSPSADLASQLFPSRSWIELLGPAVHGGSLPIAHAAALVGWSFVFGAAAWLGYRRDEGEQFT